eukprot:GHVL01009870.1.p1 GENE.GHVL01009870.1~~GHVL01009870.1.p1  ORF type:complete len:145 (-),score=25.43 GHVL01009870.1:1163-1597(-)
MYRECGDNALTASDDTDVSHPSCSSIKDDDLATNDWMRRLREVEVFDTDIRTMVLNYFINGGMQESAEAFAKEACLNTSISLEWVGVRNQIKKAILEGKAALAIDKLNEFDTAILLNNPHAEFRLKLQELLNLIIGVFFREQTR